MCCPSVVRRPRTQARRPRCAFTLVELLVVIGLITVLIALLLPAARKVRRHAAALASPVAYVTEFNGIAITHPTGRANLDISGFCICYNSWPQGPTWSPNGSWLAHVIHVPQADGQIHYIAIVEPASGVVRKFDSVCGSSDRFVGWADDGHFVESRPRSVGRQMGTILFVRDADSGALTDTLYAGDWMDDLGSMITPVPPSSGWRYVTSTSNAEGLKIILLRKDFSLGKTLHVDEASPRNPRAGPRMDPFGEYVAWTMRNPATGGNMIALKSARALTTDPVNTVGEEYGDVSFCDWTDDGKLLGAAARGDYRSQLVILDTRGKLVRTVETDADTPPQGGTPGSASWRKYMHQ